MPAARVVYWETTRRAPDKEALRLVFPDKSAHDYDVESLKVLDQSLEALDRRDMLFPFSLLKFRREMKKSGADVERRKELAGEMKGMPREMEGFLSAGWNEGRLSGGDAAMTLERMYEELYGLYPEFEEAKMELRERLRTHWRYLQAPASPRSPCSTSGRPLVHERRINRSNRRIINPVLFGRDD
ncbi:MAG: hypothetical protein LBK73_13425 [Treponema sp.]|jgi:hypothetical protein|nr:hypothetical protein [Treponema sp.]